MGFSLPTISQIREYWGRLKYVALYISKPERMLTLVAEVDARVETLKSHAEAAERRTLLTSIGQALTTWATLEELLVCLFAILLKIPPEKAGLVMYSIINFNVWLTLIDELFSQDKDLSEFKSRWNKISSRIRAIKDNRDRIAHHSAQMERKGEGDLIHYSYLVPSDLDTRSKTLKFKPMGSDEILSFSETVQDISVDLGEFVRIVEKAMRATSPEKSSQPTPAQDREGNAR
jgi:hypothetical protein